MNNKGQSALEYLMTYGWALVVIIIVIAALFAFGIFNPPTGGTCRGLDKLLYKDHTAASGGPVTISMQNGTGSTIDVIALTGIEYGGDFTDVDPEVITVNGVTVNSVGSASTFVVTSPTGVAPSSSGNYSGTIQIAYTNTTTDINHIETATCTGNI